MNTIPTGYHSFVPEDDYACPICFEKGNGFVAHEVTGEPHAFHLTCINEWFQRNATCPICRKNFLPAPQIPPAQRLEEDPQLREFINMVFAMTLLGEILEPS